METKDITTVLKFYFTQYDEVTGRGTEALPEELLNQLDWLERIDSQVTRAYDAIYSL